MSANNHRPIDMVWQGLRLRCRPMWLAPSRHKPIGHAQRQNQRCRKSATKPATSPRPRMGWIALVARIEATATKELRAGTSAKRTPLLLMGKRHGTTAIRQTRRTNNLEWFRIPVGVIADSPSSSLLLNRGTLSVAEGSSGSRLCWPRAVCSGPEQPRRRRLLQHDR